LRIADFGLSIADLGPVPERSNCYLSELLIVDWRFTSNQVAKIRNAKSAIRNPQSEIGNPQSEIENLQFFRLFCKKPDP